MGHYPSGASLNVIFHFLQQMRRGEVTQGFDYRDDDENKKRYGQTTVPNVDMNDLGDIGIPVSLFVGRHDLLSTTTDDIKIKELLGSSLL